MQTTRQRIALSNAGKFTCIDNARHCLANQKYWTTILMGEVGTYLVPSTPREASVLIALGYEELPRQAQVA